MLWFVKNYKQFFSRKAQQIVKTTQTHELIKSQAHELKDFSDIVGSGFLTLLFYKETPPPLTHTHTHTHTPNPFPCSF